MTNMVSEMYDALKEAGASEDKARKAAEAMSKTDDRFAKIDAAIAALQGNMELRFMQVEGKILTLQSGMEARFTNLGGRFLLHQWMLGFVLAFVVLIATKLFLK